jgi:hypothetical protein
MKLITAWCSVLLLNGVMCAVNVVVSCFVVGQRSLSNSERVFTSGTPVTFDSPNDALMLMMLQRHLPWMNVTSMVFPMLSAKRLSSLKKKIDLFVSLNNAGENKGGWLIAQEECCFVPGTGLVRQRLCVALLKTFFDFENVLLSSLRALLPSLRMQICSKARASFIWSLRSGT